jgi:hypothetical protein
MNGSKNECVGLQNRLPCFDQFCLNICTLQIYIYIYIYMSYGLFSWYRGLTEVLLHKLISLPPQKRTSGPCLKPFKSSVQIINEFS